MLNQNMGVLHPTPANTYSTTQRIKFGFRFSHKLETEN
jgi:hypothetical protein